MGPVGHCQVAIEVFSWAEDRERERTREKDSVEEKWRAQERSYRIHAGVMCDCLVQGRAEEMTTDPYSMSKKTFHSKGKQMVRKNWVFSPAPVSRGEEAERVIALKVSYGMDTTTGPDLWLEPGLALGNPPTDLLSLPSQETLHFHQGLGGDEQFLWLTKPSAAVLGAGKVGL